MLHTTTFPYLCTTTHAELMRYSSYLLLKNNCLVNTKLASIIQRVNENLLLIDPHLYPVTKFRLIALWQNHEY